MKTKTQRWLLGIGGGASAVTILTWFGLTPFSKADSGNTEQHANRGNATRHGQSGGITANNVVVNQYPAKPPRQLTASLEKDLLSKLATCGSVKVTVTALFNDGEAIAYAEQITAFLSKNGYQVDGVEKQYLINLRASSSFGVRTVKARISLWGDANSKTRRKHLG